MLHPAAVPYVLCFATSAITVWLITPLIRYLGLKAGLVDKPNERKMHHIPTVRVGGVAIFLGSVIALLLIWGGGWFGYLPPSKEYEIWGVTIGGAVFFLIGFADDLFNLPAIPRLIAQLVASALAWRVGVGIDFISIPFIGIVKFESYISLPLTMLWLSGMANAINWMDGLDGLAAGVATIAAAIILVTSLFMNQSAAALIAAALAGACLGFLRYNFKPRSPAEIFMGDGGAYYLGFTLAGVSIIGVAKSVTTIAVVLPYLILAVPILDGATVIFERWRKGIPLTAPGKIHLHHRLVQAGVPKRLTVLFIYSLTLFAGSWAMAISGMPAGGTYAALSTLLMLYVCWQVAWEIRRWRQTQKPPNSKDA